MPKFDNHPDYGEESAQPVIATIASGLERRGKDAAYRHIKLLAGDANARMSFALIHQFDPSVPARHLDGPLNAHWDEITAASEKGFGTFIVVNEGGRTDGTIRAIRALFLEGRDIELPTMWHRQPDFVVLGDETPWCAYWTVRAFQVVRFLPTQAKLAEMYETDIAGNSLARLMPLAGTRRPVNATHSDEIALVEWLKRSNP